MPRKHSDNAKIRDVRKRLVRCLEDIQALETELPEIEVRSDLDEICGLFADVRILQDRIGSLSSKVSSVSDKLSYEIMPETFKRWRTISPYHHVRGTFALSTRTHAKILDKPQAFDWLRANNLGGLIQETVPWQSLGAAAGELIEKGQDLPSTLFDVKTTLYTRFTLSKQEKMDANSKERVAV